MTEKCLRNFQTHKRLTKATLFTSLHSQADFLNRNFTLNGNSHAY
jgi:hypothetical protein